MTSYDQLFYLVCSGGSSAAKMASSKTFFNPFCKRNKFQWIIITSKMDASAIVN